MQGDSQLTPHSPSHQVTAAVVVVVTAACNHPLYPPLNEDDGARTDASQADRLILDVPDHLIDYYGHATANAASTTVWVRLVVVMVMLLLLMLVVGIIAAGMITSFMMIVIGSLNVS